MLEEEVEFNEVNLHIMKEMQPLLDSRVGHILTRMTIINGHRHRFFETIDKIEIVNDQVEILTYYDRGGCKDYSTYSFPVSYLFNEDWEEDYKIVKEERELAKKAYEEEQRKIAREKQEAAELEKFQQLKAKYEPKQEYIYSEVEVD